MPYDIVYTSYMELTIGPLGFSIPTQTLSSCPEVNLSPLEVSRWCKDLPVADIGLTTKKLFHVLSDCNKVALEPNDRFQILELFSTPLHIIFRSLHKHYTHQTKRLTKHQLIIANLAQTLQIEMSNGYKLVVEQIMQKSSTEIKKTLLPIALQRIVHHINQIIFHNYQLYSALPKGTWKELHLAYKLAEANQTNSILDNDYKRTLLFSISKPYYWNQSEQIAFYKATETWADLISLLPNVPENSESSIYVINLEQDNSPILMTPESKNISASYKVMDVNPVISRVKSLIEIIEPNELKAKIAHIHEAEYGVSLPQLKGLLSEWSSKIKRVHERDPSSESVRICVGLRSTHYHLNEQKEFRTGDSEEPTNNSLLALPTLTVQEDETDISESSSPINTPQESEAFTNYPLYACTVTNKTSFGYGLLWPDNTYPPIQGGELIGLQHQKEDTSTWEICKIRWLQHSTENEFRIGVEILTKSAIPSAIQLVEEGKAAGINLRCLLLESSLIVPTLPFKSGNRVYVTPEHETTKDFELTELLDATGSYKQFGFTIRRSSAEKGAALVSKAEQTPAAELNPSETQSNDDGFDSVWSHL